MMEDTNANNQRDLALKALLESDKKKQIILIGHSMPSSSLLRVGSKEIKSIFLIWCRRRPKLTIKMKILKGDIVEIITAKYQNWSEIPRHEQGYFENQKEIPPTRGVRFKVHSISEYKNERKVCAMINGRFQLNVSVDCVMIYKRPLINYLKMFFLNK